MKAMMRLILMIFNLKNHYIYIIQSITMTHIMLNVKYHELLPILKDEKLGVRMVEDWCNYNNHTLVKRPEMYVFPSTYVERKDTSGPWDAFGLSSMGLQDNYSYLGFKENDVVRQHHYHGYTGFGILKESHISIHTYPEQKCMHVDLFSCKQLDYHKNKAFMEKYFEKGKSSVFKIEFINRSL